LRFPIALVGAVVFPASSGVILSIEKCHKVPYRIPRQLGGDPASQGYGDWPGAVVFPASSGVIRVSGFVGQDRCGIPRQLGGDPHTPKQHVRA